MKSRPRFSDSVPNPLPDFTCGLDEAGRGAWAGPVVAAAVILQGKRINGLDDSKKLTVQEREQLFEKIMERCIVGIGISENILIDSHGIKHATHQAMQQALFNVPVAPELLLIDGCDRFAFPVFSIDVIEGDSLFASISAASIIAKVTRDRLMVDWEKKFPGYGFDLHKGYGTKLHQGKLAELGVSDFHRKSYAPIASCLAALSPVGDESVLAF